jgi:hypothetical protein
MAQRKGTKLSASAKAINVVPMHPTRHFEGARFAFQTRTDFSPTRHFEGARFAFQTRDRYLATEKSVVPAQPMRRISPLAKARVRNSNVSLARVRNDGRCQPRHFEEARFAFNSGPISRQPVISKERTLLSDPDRYLAPEKSGMRAAPPKCPISPLRDSFLTKGLISFFAVVRRAGRHRRAKFAHQLLL